MITEIFEEVSILVETFIQPRKLTRLEVGVRLLVSIVSHGPSVSRIASGSTRLSSFCSCLTLVGDLRRR